MMGHDRGKADRKGDYRDMSELSGAVDMSDASDVRKGSPDVVRVDELVIIRSDEELNEMRPDQINNLIKTIGKLSKEFGLATKRIDEYFERLCGVREARLERIKRSQKRVSGEAE